MKVPLPLCTSVQVTPSVDRRMAALGPTATHTAPPKATASSVTVVGEVAAVHVTPSVELTRVPCSPTATQRPPPKATPLSLALTPLLAGFQLFPSDEVAMTPLAPTVTQPVVPWATAESLHRVERRAGARRHREAEDQGAHGPTLAPVALSIQTTAHFQNATATAANRSANETR